MNNGRVGGAAYCGGISVLDIILIVNIILKLIGVGEVATWSWALVLWPLWASLGVIAIFIIVLIIAFIKFR